MTKIKTKEAESGSKVNEQNVLALFGVKYNFNGSV